MKFTQWQISTILVVASLLVGAGVGWSIKTEGAPGGIKADGIVTITAPSSPATKPALVLCIANSKCQLNVTFQISRDNQILPYASCSPDPTNCVTFYGGPADTTQTPPSAGVEGDYLNRDGTETISNRAPLYISGSIRFAPPASP
jgi:hypothetical protein